METNPCRPGYGMASDLPLNLFQCDFEDVEWVYDQVVPVSYGLAYESYDEIEHGNNSWFYDKEEHCNNYWVHDQVITGQ